MKKLKSPAPSRVKIHTFHFPLPVKNDDPRKTVYPRRGRLQCSFNRFQNFLKENPTRIVAQSTTNEFRGGAIAAEISSSRRVFKTKEQKEAEATAKAAVKPKAKAKAKATE